MSEADRNRGPAADDDDTLFSEASAWFYRLRADDHTAAERAAFRAWVARGPREAQAWRDVTALLRSLEAPAREAHRRLSPAPRRAAFAARVALRTAAVLLLAVLTVWGALRGPAFVDDLRADHATGVGERRTVTLPDGSRAELDGDTALVLAFDDAGARRVRLLRGEAWFAVRPDAAHPFCVDAGAGVARVVGTEFGVLRRGDVTTVTVGEGLVDVAPRQAGEGLLWDAAVRLRPDESVDARAGTLSAVRAADLTAAFAWRRGQLVFRQQPLSAVVTALNRSSHARIVLLNGEAGSRIVSGVFALDRPDAVIDALERMVAVRAVRITPYLILLV